jgi:hypothetical protein
MVAGAYGDADEGQGRIAGDGGNRCQRPVAAGDAEGIGAASDGVAGDRNGIVIGIEDDDLDPPRAGVLSKGHVLCFAAT